MHVIGEAGRQALKRPLLSQRPSANDWADYWLYQTCTEFGKDLRWEVKCTERSKNAKQRITTGCA
eukprot:4934167-Amphidinium_carterae.1